MSPTDRPRVLCVDDDASILAALNRQLRGRYDVVMACGAAAGLDRLCDTGPFAVVVSDLHMPGMDGHAFLARARMIAPQTVAVVLTGSADSDATDAVDPAGLVFRQLPKPCLPDALWAALDAAVAHHARSASGVEARP